MHQIAEKLGPKVWRALPGLHSMTGCDINSAISGMGKKKALQLIKGSDIHQVSLAGLGEELKLPETLISSCKKICDLHAPNTIGTNADDIR